MAQWLTGRRCLGQDCFAPAWACTIALSGPAGADLSLEKCGVCRFQPPAPLRAGAESFAESSMLDREMAGSGARVALAEGSLWHARVQCLVPATPSGGATKQNAALLLATVGSRLRPFQSHSFFICPLLRPCMPMAVPLSYLLRIAAVQALGGAAEVPSRLAGFNGQDSEARTRPSQARPARLLSPGCAGDGQVGREFGRPDPSCSMMRPTRA